jgi:hypothetical protein
MALAVLGTFLVIAGTVGFLMVKIYKEGGEAEAHD